MRTLKAWGNVSLSITWLGLHDRRTERLVSQENAEEKLKENAKGKRKKVTLQDYFSQASSASNSSQDDSDHDSSAQEDELESELGFDVSLFLLERECADACHTVWWHANLRRRGRRLQLRYARRWS